MIENTQVAIVGAGAAGYFAAIRAAERGRQVVLLEKNRKPAVKILMSGGTRCNLTQATDRRGIVEAFGKQGRFLHSALAMLGPEELVAWFDEAGVPTKVEPTGKIFPVSDRAVDVAAALQRKLDRTSAKLSLQQPVQQVEQTADGFLIRTPSGNLAAKKLVLTTGGQSYPGCGTTGDGYAWAKQLGHKIIPPRPALVPLLSNTPWVNDLSGVTVPDVGVRIVEGVAAQKKPLAMGRGSFLFTHFGLSGPVVMDVSRVITSRPDSGEWHAVCDFVPSRNEQELSDALVGGNHAVLSLVSEWLPKRLAEALLTRIRNLLWISALQNSPRKLAIVLCNRSSGCRCRFMVRRDSRKPKSPPGASTCARSIRKPCRASSARISTSPAKSSTSTDRSAATTFRPRLAPVGWPASPFKWGEICHGVTEGTEKGWVVTGRDVLDASVDEAERTLSSVMSMRPYARNIHPIPRDMVQIECG